MKRILFFTLLSFSVTFGWAQEQRSEILGTWVNEEGNTHIEIFLQNDHYFGKIVWLEAPNNKKGEPKTDRNNPDKSLRDRPIEGMIILSDLAYQNGQWVDGTIYSPLKGKTADCTAILNGTDELQLSISLSFFSTTKTWKRI